LNPIDSQVSQPQSKSWTLLWNAIFWVVTLIYLETVLHTVIFHSISLRYGYLIGFTAVIGLAVSAILTWLPRRVAANLSTILTVIFCVLYASQIVYYFIFGSMYALSMVSLGGGAVTSFWKETLLTIGEHLPAMVFTMLPIPAVCLARKYVGWIFEPNRTAAHFGVIAGVVVLQILLMLALRIGGTGFYTVYSYYHGNDATTDQTADCFGLLTTFRLEFQHMFREESDTGYFLEQEQPKETAAPVTDYGYNVLDIDFDALSEMTEDEKLKSLNAYCASLSGTRKNEYTGMLSDYNLIVLCAESFSTAAIDPDLTPTLYKMAHEGIVFNNYYNTYPNTTTDGEYSLCQGLLPDKTRGKTASSFYASRNSYLPMCLGNMFLEQRGIQCYGYHNYYGSYYGRYLSHPNMGYTMKFAGQGMTFTTSWPASDLEMMEQSLPDYLSQDQFHAYYMTFSGHYKYDTAVNPMAVRNYDAVKDLPYSNPSKCYLSCNLELEKAMAYLMEQLEAAGVADRTAIVLAGDHFPYGLTYDQYDELIGHQTDYFERYKDTLIFWVGGLEEPIEVDEYCCNIDILPTILNLWGFDYDSRLLAGTDVFSDSPHMAILIDQSFLTDQVWFDSNTNTATYLVDESELPAGYLDNLIKTVKNRFAISTDILNTAYYNFVFQQDSVRVDTSGWISEEEWNGTTPVEQEEPPEEPVNGSEGDTQPQEGADVPPETGPEEVPPVADLVQEPEENLPPVEDAGVNPALPPEEIGTDPVTDPAADPAAQPAADPTVETDPAAAPVEDGTGSVPEV